MKTPEERAAEIVMPRARKQIEQTREEFVSLDGRLRSEHERIQADAEAAQKQIAQAIQEALDEQEKEKVVVAERKVLLAFRNDVLSLRTGCDLLLRRIDINLESAKNAALGAKA